MPSNPDNPSLKFELTFDDDVVTMELEFHFSDNAEEFIDVQRFITLLAAQLVV